MNRNFSNMYITGVPSASNNAKQQRMESFSESSRKLRNAHTLISIQSGGSFLDYGSKVAATTPAPYEDLDIHLD
jgi:hypothetical protein